MTLIDLLSVGPETRSLLSTSLSRRRRGTLDAGLHRQCRSARIHLAFGVCFVEPDSRRALDLDSHTLYLPPVHTAGVVRSVSSIPTAGSAHTTLDDAAAMTLNSIVESSVSLARRPARSPPIQQRTVPCWRFRRRPVASESPHAQRRRRDRRSTLNTLAPRRRSDRDAPAVPGCRLTPHSDTVRV